MPGAARLPSRDSNPDAKERLLIVMPAGRVPLQLVGTVVDLSFRNGGILKQRPLECVHEVATLCVVVADHLPPLASEILKSRHPARPTVPDFARSFSITESNLSGLSHAHAEQELGVFPLRRQIFGLQTRIDGTILAERADTYPGGRDQSRFASRHRVDRAGHRC